MHKRWLLFLGLHKIGMEREPDLEMAEKFTTFMYKFRQRASSAGKIGLGDSMGEMAQYILAQVRAMRA